MEMTLRSMHKRTPWLDPEGRRISVHGTCRAGFSSWAYEAAAAREGVIEACLAHAEPNKTKASYNRADYFVERKALLAAWARHCCGETPASNVVPITVKAA
jgi:integrase